MIVAGPRSTTLPDPLSVPLFATRDAIEPLLPEVATRMRSVLDSGRYVLGPEVSAFEAEFAEYLGAEHCVGVANGTDALTIALRALGVGPGAEVIVPAVSFYATAEAVVNAGARPVFADVDPETWCLTAATVEPLLNERTAALVPVHLFGNPAPVGELLELARSRGGQRIRVLEDAAQAAGAKLNGDRAGALADAATFSFYPSKNLGGFGDGGAITTSDDEVAERARQLRFHGSTDKKVHTAVGYNSRLDELQAAALRVLLPHLDEWTAARRDVAGRYHELGLGDAVTPPVETPSAKSCFHLYVISTPRRDELAAKLSELGIGNRVYYTPALHEQPGMAEFKPADRLLGADAFCESCLALPMGQSLDDAGVEQVVESVTGALNKQ
jgi:dTDP-4-amino-4,6-dideoxygalactose transaminase